MKDILEQSNIGPPTGWRVVLWGLTMIGMATFVAGFVFEQSLRTWQAVLINAVFWGGMAQAGVLLSAIWQVTDSRWGRPFKRISESFMGFMPFAFLAFMVVLFGANELYEWVSHPIEAKKGYLNLTFFAWRNAIGLLIVFGFTWFYVRNAMRPDLAEARKIVPEWGGAFVSRVLKDYDHSTQADALALKARCMAPVLIMLHALVFTMVAFDYIMSLDQEWFSTLFGVFFIVGNLYSALALMLILSAWLRKYPAFAEYITLNRFNDLAKLTFGTAMLYTYMVFSQYIVIWYANLPEETPFLVTRSISNTPWRPLFWILVILLFVLPFLSLMPRTICRSPRIASWIAGVLFLGQWWAHYLLIVPSIQDRISDHPSFVFGWIEIFLTGGFAGVFFLSLFWFLGKSPILPIGDSRLCKTWHGR